SLFFHEAHMQDSPQSNHVQPSRVPEKQEWLEYTLDSMVAGVITTDPAGSVVFVNPAAQSLTGWTRVEAEGKPLGTIFQLIDAKTRNPLESPVVRVISEAAVVGPGSPAVLLARDGTERAIDHYAAPISDGAGHVRGVVLTFQDVTERTKKERELRAKAASLEEMDKRRNEF